MSCFAPYIDGSGLHLPTCEDRPAVFYCGKVWSVIKYKMQEKRSDLIM